MLLPLLRFLLPGLLASTGAVAASLDVQPAPAHCGLPAPTAPSWPAAAAARIPDSVMARGTRDVAWAWLGSPTTSYSHAALGSAVHAGSLHVLLNQPDGSLRPLSLTLQPNRVIEDRVPRLADLDGDGRDDVIVIESDARLGSSLVVYGLRLGAAARQPVLAQLARSPFIGTAQRWLNPIGVADFDGDGRPDIAAVVTPHIGGVLTLYRYQPPSLEPIATMNGVSNHRNGTVEQQLAAIVQQPGRRAVVVVPGSDLRTLHAVRMEGAAWQQFAPAVPLSAPVQRMSATPAGACVLLANGATLQVTVRD